MTRFNFNPDLTESQIRELNERSFTNMVRFYRDELRQILDGSRSVDILKASSRRHLRKNGILYAPVKKKGLTVSPRAISILTKTPRGGGDRLE